jgi:hypothetical protein
MALRPDALTGSNLSIEMAIDLDSWSLGFAIRQIYNLRAHRAADVGTVLSGTVKR